LNVIRSISKSQKAFSTVAALIRIHLISHLDIKWVVVEGQKAYTNEKKGETKVPQPYKKVCFEREVGF